MNKTNAAKKPFHEAFAEKIIGLLEAGTAPWQKSWTPAENLAPRNPVSGTVYKGVNRLNLSLAGYEDPRWMTFKQANDAGYRIKKGSQATTIVFYQFTREEDKRSEDGKVVLGEDGKPEKETVRLERPIIRFSQVFNGTQIEGLPPLEKKEVEYTWQPHEKAQSILARSGAVIKHDQMNQNFYRPRTDEIHLTPKSSFDAPDKYYATALHELGHWTGHPSRMNREFGPFGSAVYAREELRAEISSWMIGEDVGVGHDPGNHAAYVQSWIRDLRDNPLEIMRACRDAEHIKDYVLGLEMQKEHVRETGREVEQRRAMPPDQAMATDPALSKTYLYVPYREKESAKAHGARWDREHKQWYAPEGVDLAPLRQWLSPPEKQIRPQECLDPRQEFAQKLADLGLDLKGSLPELDGRTHRVPLLSKNGRGLDGAYCLHGDGIPAGWAQNHSTGEKVKLVASGVMLSPAERERQKAEHAARLEQAERERAQARDAAAERCRQLWESFEPAAPDHPYLEKKGVAAFGLKQGSYNDLIVPLRNIRGELRGIQSISSDGQKAFAAGIEKTGNFHLIGGEDKDLSQAEIVLCEGYATGASLYMASQKPVAVAFDAGNLESVAKKIRERYPRAQITICADNDHAMKPDGRVNNVGVEKAEKAAKSVGGRVIVPTFTKEETARGLTDFNDLHQSRGLEAVKRQIGLSRQHPDLER